MLKTLSVIALSCVFTCFHAVLCLGQTIINVPSSPSPTSAGANTIVNVLPGGVLTASNSFIASDGAVINILGGRTHELITLALRTGATVNAQSGGINGRLAAENGGIISHTGGRTSAIALFSGGTASVSGGAINQVGAHTNSSLTLNGVDFLLNGVPIAGLTQPGESVNLNLSASDVLTAVLADGTAFGYFKEGITEATQIDSGVLTLTRSAEPATPAPGTISINSPSTLLSAGNGQIVSVENNGQLTDMFRAGPGSVIQVNGGQIKSDFHAIDAELIINSGRVGGAFKAFNNSVVTVRGGTLDSGARFYHNSTLNLENGEVGANVRMRSGSTANITGGSISQLSGYSGSEINVLGGTVQQVGTDGTLQIQGGVVERLSVSSTGTLEVSGGVLGDDFRVQSSGQATFYASEFRLNGNLVAGLVNPGDFVTIPITPRDVNNYYSARSDYISGVFENGLPFVLGGELDPIATSVKLVLTDPFTPNPMLIQVPPTAAPQGIHSGQTLLLQDGGLLPDNFTAGHGSSLQITGGTVGRNLEAIGAQVDVTGGQFNTLDAFSGTNVNIGGTAAWSGMTVYGGAVANIYGGTYNGGNFQALSGGIVNITDGQLNGAFAADNASVNISGGSISAYQRRSSAANQSTVTITGGSINALDMYSASSLLMSAGSASSIQSSSDNKRERTQVHISGGHLERLSVYDNSDATITGGSIDSLGNSEATTTIFGGALGDNVDWSSGNVQIHGYDFQVNGIPITIAGNSSNFNYTPGTMLTGKLADGTPFNFADFDSSPISINDGVVKLFRATPPTLPGTIHVPTVPAPYGVSAGQSLIVDDGGALGHNFIAGQNSVVEIRGGTVGHNFEADRSQVTVSGGVVGDNWDVFKGATVTVTNGTLGKEFEVHDGAILNISGGTLGALGKARGGTVNMSGGELGSGFDALAGSVIRISGGNVKSEFEALAGSTVEVSGGAIDANFRINDGAISTISGGTLRELEVNSGGSALITSGTIEDLNTSSSSRVDVRGGSFGDGFSIHSSSISSLHGVDFKVDGVPIAGLDAVGNEVAFTMGSNRLFTGVFADGTPFAFRSSENDSITNLKLVRAPDLSPPISDITVTSDLAPRGVRDGQTLTVVENGQLSPHFNAGEGSIVNILGGTIGNNFEAYGALINIEGGTVANDFDAFAGSQINIRGGSIGTNLDAYTGSIVNLTGGSATHIDALSGSSITISGGYLGMLGAAAGSQTTWDGGVLGGFSAASTAAIGIHGASFEINGVPVPGLESPGSMQPINIPSGTVLTGMLADGTPLVIGPTIQGPSIANGVLTLYRSDTPSAPLPQSFYINDQNAPRTVGFNQKLILASGGQLPAGFIAGQGSNVLIKGGTVLSGFRVFDAEISIEDGEIGSGFTALAGADLKIMGGQFSSFAMYGDAKAEISGGSFPNQVSINSGAILDIYGKSFLIGGVPISQLQNIGDSFRITQFSGQLLTAILHDGSQINWRLSQSASDPRIPLNGISREAIVTLHLVPEPSALLLVLIGSGFLPALCRCRKKS